MLPPPRRARQRRISVDPVARQLRAHRERLLPVVSLGPLPRRPARRLTGLVVRVKAQQTRILRSWSSRQLQSDSTASAPATTSSPAGVRPGPRPIDANASLGSRAAIEPAIANASLSGNPNADAGSSSRTPSRSEPEPERAPVAMCGRGSHHRTGRHEPACVGDRPGAEAATLPASGRSPVAKTTPIGRRTASFDNRAITDGFVPGSGTLRYDATLVNAPEPLRPGKVREQVADSDARPRGRHLRPTYASCSIATAGPLA